VPIRPLRSQYQNTVLKRDTSFTMDEWDHNNSPRPEISNFRVSPDRDRGDVINLLARHGK